MAHETIGFCVWGCESLPQQWLIRFSYSSWWFSSAVIYIFRNHDPIRWKWAKLFSYWMKFQSCSHTLCWVLWCNKHRYTYSTSKLRVYVAAISLSTVTWTLQIRAWRKQMLVHMKKVLPARRSISCQKIRLKYKPSSHSLQDITTITFQATACGFHYSHMKLHWGNYCFPKMPWPCMNIWGQELVHLWIPAALGLRERRPDVRGGSEGTVRAPRTPMTRSTSVYHLEDVLHARSKNPHPQSVSLSYSGLCFLRSSLY